MSHTNSTTNYGLPQWIGTDKPTFLGDFNSAFSTIDTAMKNNADAATTAVSTANTASTAATTASTNATTALNTANSAATDAATAVTTAGAADTKATQALAAASTAETAAAANTITNLAPAYDSTLTYAVGDLVTYVDAQGSGKLYKCIVAVGTPEEFNINKWDDVTTSEAYAPNHEIIYERTLTETVTTENVLADLLNHFSELVSILTKDLKLIFATTNGVIVYNTDEINKTPSNGLLKFSRVNCSKGGTVYNEMLAIYEGDSTKVARMTTINTDGTSSSSDFLSDNVLAGNTIRVIRG